MPIGRMPRCKAFYDFLRDKPYLVEAAGPTSVHSAMDIHITQIRTVALSKDNGPACTYVGLESRSKECQIIHLYRNHHFVTPTGGQYGQ